MGGGVQDASGVCIPFHQAHMSASLRFFHVCSCAALHVQVDANRNEIALEFCRQEWELLQPVLSTSETFLAPEFLAPVPASFTIIGRSITTYLLLAPYGVLDLRARVLFDVWFYSLDSRVQGHRGSMCRDHCQVHDGAVGERVHCRQADLAPTL